MKRTVGVTVAAVVALVGSLLALLMGALTLLFISLVPMPALGNPLARFGLYVGLAMMAGGGVWGLVTSIGLFRLRRWARYSILVFSGLAVFFSATGLLMFAMLPDTVFGPAGEQVASLARILIYVAYGVPLLIGCWWLVLFNRASVKGQFAGEAPEAAVRRTPVSILVIAWFFLITGALMLACGFFRWPAGLFGWVLTGWKAALIYLFYAVAHLYLGWGLLKLAPRSRTLAIYFELFVLLNLLLFLFLPGWDERVAASMTVLSPEMRSQVQGTPLTNQWWLTLILGLGGPVAILWFLIREKASFEPKAAESAAGSAG